jgi:hypothetical protein
MVIRLEESTGASREWSLKRRCSEKKADGTPYGKKYHFNAPGENITGNRNALTLSLAALAVPVSRSHVQRFRYLLSLVPFSRNIKLRFEGHICFSASHSWERVFARYSRF